VELRHIRYFVAVAEESSLGGAAHRLHLSQPALSQQINDLEGELGLKLLTRNSREVQLTEAGRTFLAGGRRVLVSRSTVPSGRVPLFSQAAKRSSIEP
jgi:DNA-binding transcriptional LysR family regulator